MTSSIPLCRLPHNAIKVVFKQLHKCDFESIICLSTCATKAKLLVESMKLKAYIIKVYVRDELSISILRPNEPDYSVLNPTHSTDLGTQTPCQIFLPSSSTVLSKPSVKHWLNHFLFIFNKETIDLQFSSSDMWIYSLESIHESLRGLRIDFLNISKVDEEEFNFKILGFFPLMKNLFMGQFDEREEPDVSEESFNQLKRIITANMISISLKQDIPLDLDTLLMTNGIEINLSSPRLSDKDFNVFLKLWTRGSNPRLEILQCSYPDEGTREFAESVILKGLQYEKQQRNLVRTFQPDHHKPNGSLWLDGGYDIRRKDQTVATFFFESNHFSMYVWSSTNTYTADGLLS